MKLGIIQRPVAESLEYAKSLGLDFVEFDCNYPDYFGRPMSEVVKEQEAIKKAVAETGVEVGAVGRWASQILNEKGEVVPEEWAEVKAVIDFGAYLGAKYYLCSVNYVQEISYYKNITAAIGVLREEKVIDGIVKGYAGGSGRTYEAQLDPAQTELKLSLAVKAAYYPYAYTDENGDLVGIDVDIAYALCDYLGVGLELVPLEDGIIEPVLYGRVNFSSGGLLGTEDDRVDYTDPYTDISEELITRK